MLRPLAGTTVELVALETDWLAGASGFEPLHLEIRSAELHPASTGFGRRSGAP
jgi:hypothetical protein